MKAAFIQATDRTLFAMIKGLAVRNDDADFLETLSKYRTKLSEDEFLVILEKLALNGNNSLLVKVGRFD